MIGAKPQLEFGQQRSPITDWVLRVGVGLFFFAAGTEKFTAGPHSEWIRIFAQIGWGDWFRYFTGGIETLGALLLLVPRLTMAGTVLLACSMIGAILAHCIKLGSFFQHHSPGTPCDHSDSGTEAHGQAGNLHQN